MRGLRFDRTLSSLGSLGWWPKPRSVCWPWDCWAYSKTTKSSLKPVGINKSLGQRGYLWWNWIGISSERMGSGRETHHHRILAWWGHEIGATPLMSHPSRGNDGRIKGHELLSIQLNVCRSYGMSLLAVASSKHKVESFYSKKHWNVHECSKHLSQTHPEHKFAGAFVYFENVITFDHSHQWSILQDLRNITMRRWSVCPSLNPRIPRSLVRAWQPACTWRKRKIMGDMKREITGMCHGWRPHNGVGLGQNLEVAPTPTLPASKMI